jgi:hypothetical protein
MRTLMAILLVAPLVAGAQEQQPQQGQVDDRPYWERCQNIMRMQPYVPYRVDVPLRIAGDVAAGSARSSGGGASGGGGSKGGAPLIGGGGGGGGNLGYAVLVLAVVVIAALPIIIYAVDGEADPLTQQRFACPEFNFSMMGGASFASSGYGTSGLLTARLRTTIQYFGADAEVDVSPVTTPAGSFSAHLLFRPPPKKHIEGALAVGVRREAGPGGVLTGVDVGLPHEYVFWREGYKHFGLELTPRVFVHSAKGVDAGVEANLVIPLADFMQIRAGGQVFSHGGLIQGALAAGLSAWF